MAIPHYTPINLEIEDTGPMRQAKLQQQVFDQMRAYEIEKEAARGRRNALDNENMQVRMQNPQMVQRQIPAQRGPNPTFMSPGEIEGVVAPEAKQNALAAMVQGGQDPRQMQQLVQQERAKLMQGVSPEMQQPTREIAPARTEEAALPFEAKSYGELQAMQKHAEQFGKFADSRITAAFNTKNKSVLTALAEQARKTGNPILGKTAELLDSITFEGNEFASVIDLTNPDTKRALFTKFEDFFKASGMESPEMMPDGEYKIKFRGDIGAGNMLPYDMVRTDKVFNNNTTGTESKRWVTKGDQKVVFTMKDGTFQDADGKKLGRDDVELMSNDSLMIGRGMKGFIQHKTIPGAFFNRADGKTYVDMPQKDGSVKRVAMDTLNVQDQAKYWTPEMQKLKQQGGVRAVNAYVAADTYKAEAEELLAIRDRLAAKNPGIFSGVGSQMRKVNDISQWAKMNTGDDPDLAEFIKGTTLLADVLMNAVGGAQGGQWAFELASKLLDPTLPKEAYKSTIDKHMRTLQTKAGIYSGVGQKPGSSGYTERPMIPGEVSKTPKALMPPVKGTLLDKKRAIEYFKIYGNKQSAEKAARADGWGL